MNIHLILAGNLDNPDQSAPLKNLNTRTIKKTIRSMDPSLEKAGLKNLTGQKIPGWVQDWANNKNVAIHPFVFFWDDCLFIITK